MKLGNIGDWGAGATPNRSNKSYYENGDVLWVKTGELNDGYIFDSIEKITTKALNECSLRNNNIGDVLIAMYGATIGKLGITAVPLTTNQACCACTPFSFINNEYLFYYLMAIKPLLISKSYGGAQPNISKEKITNCFINFPKIDEQILIVNKIKELFKKIETIGNEYNSIINLISATKRKVLEEIFGENSSYKSYYPSLPLKDICKLDKRENKSSGKLPYLEAKVIRGQKSPTILESGSLVYKGEKIILVDGENSGEVMTVPYDGYMGSTFKLLTIDTNKLDIEYFGFYLLTHKQQFRENKTGSAVPHLNKKIFNSLEICVPPIEEQKKITANLKNIFEKLNIVAS